MPRPLRTYRWLMQALPSAFLARFGADMLAMVEGRADDVRGASPLFWVREYVDLGLTVLREWRAEFHNRRTRAGRGRRILSFRNGLGDGMGGDLKLAIRMVLRSPGFSAVVVLTLALGMGVNAAIFSIVDTVVLRPLPYDRADELVGFTAFDTRTGQQSTRISYADFLEFQDQAESLDGIAGYLPGTWTLSGVDRVPTQINIAQVTNDFFSLLGARPVLGRTFVPEEHLPDRRGSLIISHSFWQSEFGGSPDVLGKVVTLSIRPMTIIGVMEHGFDYPYLREMAGWVAMEHREFMGADPNLAFSQRDWRALVAFARLNEQASLERAGAEIDALAVGIAVAFPESNANLETRLISLKEVEVGQLRRPLLLLLGVVAAILLIAAVNTASLLLARGTARAGEVAVRTALGASRGRLVRLFLSEALVYAVLGAGAGLVLAQGVLAIVARLGLQGPRLEYVSLDGRVMAIMGLVTIVTGLLFGLAPALQGSRVDLQDQLKDGGRGSSAGLGKSRIQKVFVATEMALSTVLVIGAGLLVTSFINTIREDPGFDPDNVMSVRISLPGAYMEDPDDNWSGSNEFFFRLGEDIERIPGVESVAFSYTNPLEPATAFNTRFQIQGFLERPRSEQPFANLRTVTPGFFEAFRIPVLQGRTFNDRDLKESPGVVVINETLRRLHFGDENPIGHRLQGPNFWGPAGYPRDWEIIGVVGDVRSAGLSRDPTPAFYFPFRQAPMGNMRLITRAGVDPRTLGPQIREAVWNIDSRIPMENLHTMQEFISDSVATPRLAMMAVGSFALLALLLASIGVYGVLSYTVGLRRAEFGIRQALGADRDRILGLVLRQGLRVTALGVVSGLVLSLALGRFLNSLLYQVTATHVPTLAGVTVVLTLVAMVACIIPAIRATRVDPAGALRAE